jgi:hypothetical protein
MTQPTIPDSVAFTPQRYRSCGLARALALP